MKEKEDEYPSSLSLPSLNMRSSFSLLTSLVDTLAFKTVIISSFDIPLLKAKYHHLDFLFYC